MSGREEVIFSSEEPRSVAEIGAFLIQAGEKLREQGHFNLARGDSQVEIRPLGHTKLELKYEIEGGTKHKLEIEIEWKPDSRQPGRVDIS